MLLAALTELKFGMDAEGKPLESIANPLSHLVDAIGRAHPTSFPQESPAIGIDVQLPIIASASLSDLVDHRP